MISSALGASTTKIRSNFCRQWILHDLLKNSWAALSILEKMLPSHKGQRGKRQRGVC